MAGTTQFGNAALMRANLLKAKKMYDDTPRATYFDKLAGNTFTTQQQFEQMALTSGLALPLIVSEYGTIPSDDVTTPFTKTYTPLKHAIQFRVSDEAFINDNYNIIKGYGTMLGGVFKQAKDIAAAIFLNGATNTALITTPQNTALASTAQPLANGLTDSNTFTTQQILGIIALEDAVMNLMNQLAHKGYPMPKAGPFQLECATRNGILARRLVGANKLPQGNNNDPNVVSASIDGDPIVSPYFTNPEWWALRSVNNDEHPRFYLQRYAFKMAEPFYDQDTDSWKMTGREMYLFDVNDYRGVFYSTPN